MPQGKVAGTCYPLLYDAPQICSWQPHIDKEAYILPGQNPYLPRSASRDTPSHLPFAKTKCLRRYQDVHLAYLSCGIFQGQGWIFLRIQPHRVRIVLALL
jgi:hypothetical protein